MAAHKIFPSTEPRALPAAPATYPLVIAARDLLDRAAAERIRAEDALREAEFALEQHRSAAAEQLLAELETGEAGEDAKEADLIARIDAARRRVATATKTVLLARDRHDQAIADAKVAFSRELRPALLAALEASRTAVRAAVEVNEQLRSLAAYGAEHDEQAPRPWELAFPLPGLARLEELDAQRDALFAEPEPLQGRVAVRMIAVSMPYNPGDTCALPDDEATLFVRARVAELVDQSQAKRLGLDRLIRFTCPQRVLLTKDWADKPGGAWTSAGSTVEMDAHQAERAVNLGFGRSLGDAP